MTETTPPAGRRRLHWLDALRGVAAMAVVLGHFYWGMLAFPGHTFFDPGLFGVAVFFFISGYIVPLSVRKDTDCRAFRFAWSRLFRLYPVYWLSLALGIVVFGPGLRDSLVNVTMLQRLVGVGDVINVYWTLQIEIMFYIFIMASILLGVFNRPRVVVGAAIAFGLASIAFGFARYYLHARAPLSVPIGLAVILVGNLASLADVGGLSRTLFRRTAACVALCLIASFYLGYSQDWGHDEIPERFVVSYALAVALFFGASRLQHWRFPVATGLGAISYPMYLIHQPFREIGTVWLGGSLSQAAINGIAVAFVLVVAWVLHIVVEKPFVQLGRSLIASPAFRQFLARDIRQPQRFWAR